MATQANSYLKRKIPLPRALPREARTKIDNAIEAHLAAVEALTEFLDTADGDPDLEPYLANGAGDDREQDAGDEGEAGADDDLCGSEASGCHMGAL